MCYNFISYYRLKGGIFLNKKLIVLIGKSNAGKTTLANLIQRELGIKKVVTCTTREKRIGEKDGVDYYFLSKDVALKQVENGEFIEHEIFNDWLYGTRYVDIDLSQNQVVSILHITIEELQMYEERHYINPAELSPFLKLYGITKEDLYENDKEIEDLKYLSKKDRKEVKSLLRLLQDFKKGR